MLQMLTKMIRSIELLGRVTLPKLMDFCRVVQPLFPIFLGGLHTSHTRSTTHEVFPAVSACVSNTWLIHAFLKDIGVSY